MFDFFFSWIFDGLFRVNVSCGGSVDLGGVGAGCLENL